MLGFVVRVPESLVYGGVGLDSTVLEMVLLFSHARP